MIPECFSAYRSFIPMLEEVAEWSLLRKWSLSEVYRVTLKSGDTRIMKWGGKEMAVESAIYQQLVYPLEIKSPYIYDFFEGDNSSVMIMEDAGIDNLEQRPEPEYFLEAARELARLREKASEKLEITIPSSIIRSYTVSDEHFLALLDDSYSFAPFLRKSHSFKFKRDVSIRIEKIVSSHPSYAGPS